MIQSNFMDNPLKILHLEDIESDADLVRRELKNGSIKVDLLWVVNRADFKQALHQFIPDLIISDHSLPGFTSVEALEIVQNENRKIPFILCTATISEEFAVAIIKLGAEDYILKDRMQRLPQAVVAAMERRAVQQQKQLYLEEIGRNEKKFRGLVEKGNDLIGLFDKDLRPIYRSPNYEKITGWTSEELISMNLVTITHPSDLMEMDYAVNLMMSNPGLSVPLTYRFKHKQGNYLWVEGVITNMLHDESIHGIVSNLRDVTSDRNAAIKLEFAHEKLLFHIENSPLGFIEWDNKMKVKSWSKRAQEIFGWSSVDEFRSRQESGYTPIYIDDVQRVELIMEELLSGKIPRNHVTFRNCKKDGTIIWCEWSNSVLKNEAGEVDTIMSLVQDITERKKLEEEKSEILLRLTEQNNDLLQFSYIASHNLRGPLASLLGLIGLFDPKEITGESSRLIPHMQKSLDHLDDVIRDISNILNLRADVAHTLVEVSVLDIISTVQGLLEVQILQSGAKFNLTGLKILSIVSIKPYLHSIFYNLISNAIKFRSPDRQLAIEIRTFEADEEIGIVVSDNGTGIDLDRFGEKLFRLYHRFNLDVEGRGLGLYMVKTQLQALHGTVKVESKVGEGTTFNILLKKMKVSR